MHVKRSIRIKELKHNQKSFYFPSEEYASSRVGLSSKKGYLLVTDDSGYMLSGLPTFETDKKIFFSGDSSVENIYCDIDKRFFSSFNLNLLINSHAYKCINMAVSGATSLNLLNTVLNKLLGQQGDLFFFIPANDAYALDLEDGYLNQSRAYANIIPHKETKISTGNFQSNKNHLPIIISTLNAFCKNSNIKLHIISSIYRDPNPEQMEVDHLVETSCMRQGISYLKIENYPENSFQDNLHLTEKGSRYVSNKLYEYFSEEISGDILPQELVEKEKIRPHQDTRIIPLINNETAICKKSDKRDSFSLFADLESIGEENEQNTSALIKISSITATNEKPVETTQKMEIPPTGKRVVLNQRIEIPDELCKYTIDIECNQKFIIHHAYLIQRAFHTENT